MRNVFSLVLFALLFSGCVSLVVHSRNEVEDSYMNCRVVGPNSLKKDAIVGVPFGEACQFSFLPQGGGIVSTSGGYGGGTRELTILFTVYDKKTEKLIGSSGEKIWVYSRGGAEGIVLVVEHDERYGVSVREIY